MAEKSMHAWVLDKPGPLESASFHIQKVPKPVPGKEEALIRVLACGVCRTDLHIVEGDIKARHYPLIPGHQVVGEVVGLGSSTSSVSIGDRVGVAWLGHTCGGCRYCNKGAENLCPNSLYTGFDRQGGYAEFLTAHVNYLYPLPKEVYPETIAPLLCAGIIGYRAYRLARPSPGERIGLYGFGSSAHITAQVAKYQGVSFSVSTLGQESRQLAQQMGAQEVVASGESFKERVDHAIVFAPAGEVVPQALENIEKGGRVILAGITMTDIPQMQYEKHLFHEKQLQSVEANTRADGQELLQIALEAEIQPAVTTYAFEEAKQALQRIKTRDVRGSFVLKFQ